METLPRLRGEGGLVVQNQNYRKGERRKRQMCSEVQTQLGSTVDRYFLTDSEQDFCWKNSPRFYMERFRLNK